MPVGFGVHGGSHSQPPADTQGPQLSLGGSKVRPLAWFKGQLYI